MKWEKLTPLEGQFRRCRLNYYEAILDMGPMYASGYVTIYQDDYIWTVASGTTLADIEERAAREPDHDWRVHLLGSLGEAWYQRQDKGKWVLIEVGDGYA
jgi:hypothetical protein